MSSVHHRNDQQQRDDDDGDNEPLMTSRLLELFQRQSVPPLLHQSVISSTCTYWFGRWIFQNVSYWVSHLRRRRTAVNNTSLVSRHATCVSFVFLVLVFSHLAIFPPLLFCCVLPK
jgi:membrane protein YqaA with SNARE-associated domain